MESWPPSSPKLPATLLSNFERPLLWSPEMSVPWCDSLSFDSVLWIRAVPDATDASLLVFWDSEWFLNSISVNEPIQNRYRSALMINIDSFTDCCQWAVGTRMCPVVELLTGGAASSVQRGNHLSYTVCHGRVSWLEPTLISVSSAVWNAQVLCLPRLQLLQFATEQIAGPKSLCCHSPFERPIRWSLKWCQFPWQPWSERRTNALSLLWDSFRFSDRVNHWAERTSTWPDEHRMCLNFNLDQ